MRLSNAGPLAVAAILTAGVNSCSSTPATSSEAFRPSPILTVAAPATRSPSRTSTPQGDFTATPSPPPFSCAYPSVSPPRTTADSALQSGIYIAYFVPSRNSPSLVVKSIEGETIRILTIPPGAFLPSPEGESGISPDGRYFAYFTGFPRWMVESPTKDQYDLTLHIATIADGKDLVAIPLLRSSLLDDIQQAATVFAKNPPPGSGDASVSDMAAGLYDALMAGITSVAWSPDGRYLAFAGAIDGPSSDIYIYDTEKGESSRLTSGPEEIVKIAWSPDGVWIMHGSATSWEMGSSLTNHAVRLDGEAVVSFPFGGPYDSGWLTDREYLVNEGANGIGSFDLAILDIDSGRRLSLWPYDYGTLAFDSSASRMLLANFGDIEGAPVAGLYLIDLADREHRILDKFPLWDLAYWPSHTYQFAAAKFQDALYGVTANGGLVRLLDGNWSIAPSPDLKTLALSGDGQTQGLYLLDQPGGIPRMLDDRETFAVKWSPDSSWIMFYPGPLSGDSLLTVISSAAGQPKFIQQLPRGMCSFPSPIWIVVP